MLRIDKEVIRGVSPVVGTVLMVAIVVVLAGAAMLFFTGIGDNIGSYEPAAVDVTSTSNDDFLVDVTTLGDSEKVIAKCDNTEVEITELGQTLVPGQDCDEFVVIGVGDNDEENVVSVTDPDEMDTVEGPPIPYEPDDIAAVHDGMKQNADGAYIITTVHELQAVNHDLSADYVLGNDIRAGGTSSWNDGDGFNPLEGDSVSFAGSFDGNNYTINGLTINRPTSNNIGLFGRPDSSSISNVTIADADVTGQRYVGILGGRPSATMTNIHTSGTVEGTDAYIGGIVGRQRGTLQDSSTSADVIGRVYVGGVAGTQQSYGPIENVRATGTVTATGDFVGGIVGHNWGGNINNSYAIVDISAPSSSHVGGAIGWSEQGHAHEVYSAGAVSGGTNVGGVIGLSESTASENSTVDAVYWDTETAGQSNAIGTDNGTDISNLGGLTTNEMSGETAETNMVGFDFTNIWTIVTGDYPDLQNAR